MRVSCDNHWHIESTRISKWSTNGKKSHSHFTLLYNGAPTWITVGAVKVASGFMTSTNIYANSFTIIKLTSKVCHQWNGKSPHFSACAINLIFLIPSSVDSDQRHARPANVSKKFSALYVNQCSLLKAQHQQRKSLVPEWQVSNSRHWWRSRALVKGIIPVWALKSILTLILNLTNATTDNNQYLNLSCTT